MDQPASPQTPVAQRRQEPREVPLAPRKPVVAASSIHEATSTQEGNGLKRRLFTSDFEEDERVYLARGLPNYGDLFIDEALTASRTWTDVVEINLQSAPMGKLFTITLTTKPEHFEAHDLKMGKSYELIYNNRYSKLTTEELIAAATFHIEDESEIALNRYSEAFLDLTKEMRTHPGPKRTFRIRYACDWPESTKPNLLFILTSTPIWKRLFDYLKAEYPHMHYARFDTHARNLSELDNLFYMHQLEQIIRKQGNKKKRTRLN